MRRIWQNFNIFFYVFDLIGGGQDSPFKCKDSFFLLLFSVYFRYASVCKPAGSGLTLVDARIGWLKSYLQTGFSFDRA